MMQYNQLWQSCTKEGVGLSHKRKQIIKEHKHKSRRKTEKQNDIENKLDF
jgi:hypothetical protein